jgi:putative ABC transport system permease protein
MVNNLIDLALKNILRQKTRTILTVVGILIGIAAVVALGSISEGMNAMMNQELQFLGGTIMVSSKESSGLMLGSMDSVISKYDLENFQDFSDVKQVVPYVMKIGEITIGQGHPTQIIGIRPEDVDYFKSKGTELDSGRALETGDTYQALIGYQYAEDNDLGIGDSIEIKKSSFEVVGIIEKMDTGMDNSIILPLETMMDSYNLENYQSAFIIPEDLSKIQDVADDLKSSFDDFDFTTSNDIVKQMSRIIDMIRFFTIGISSIAAIVGGLGVMNTMIMSVLERKREIGIMKAIGATRKYILSEILLESVIISLIGGILGLLVGSVGSYSLRFVSSGLTEAKVTIPLAVGGLSFAVFLGLVGGFYPAWSAAKLDPIEAIRYE